MSLIVLVGGFLGSGKTTLILAAARVLRERGLRPAAIFNDQGADLVDTRFASASGLSADQVVGGCFCCHFSELIEATERLRAYAPDVIFAEAVGSCTDISATMLQPLKLGYSHEFRVAAYSVLVDPERGRELIAPDAPSDLLFLFQKQIEEADLICFTKADMHVDCPELDGARQRYVSALTGQGVAEWLDEVLAGRIPSGGKILDIDYDRYARAEAALAWLNCCATVTLAVPLSPPEVIGPFHEELDAALTTKGFQIAHLKLIDDADSGYLKVASVRNGGEPTVDGTLGASPAARHELLLNIRAAGDPELLEKLVRSELARLPGETRIASLQCFRPSPPKPEHRFASVVT